MHFKWSLCLFLIRICLAWSYRMVEVNIWLLRFCPRPVFPQGGLPFPSPHLHPHPPLRLENCSRGAYDSPHSGNSLRTEFTKQKVTTLGPGLQINKDVVWSGGICCPSPSAIKPNQVGGGCKKKKKKLGVGG